MFIFFIINRIEISLFQINFKVISQQPDEFISFSPIKKIKYLEMIDFFEEILCHLRYINVKI